MKMQDRSSKILYHLLKKREFASLISEILNKSVKEKRVLTAGEQKHVNNLRWWRDHHNNEVIRHIKLQNMLGDLYVRV